MKGFQVIIEPGETIADTTARVVGEVTPPPTDVYTWGSAVYELHGGYSGQFQGVYPILSMGHVRQKVEATRVKVYPPVLTPKVLAHKVWDNSQNDSPAHFEAKLSDEVSASASLGWSESASREWSASLTVEVGGGPVKASGTTGYSYTTQVGRSGEHTETESLVSEDTVSEELDPFSTAIACLLIQSGTVVVEVTLEVVFSGVVHWRARYNDSSGQETVESLIPFLQKMAKFRPKSSVFQPAVARWEIDFFRDTESKIVSIPNTTDEAIQDGLHMALNSFNGGGK